MTEVQKELKIETLTEGTGQSPVVGDTVLIHYILNLETGTSSSNYDYGKHCYVDVLEDSTYEGPTAGPIPIKIGTETPKDMLYSEGDSVPGLSQALTKMKVGSKSRLFIPSQLAYGVEGGSSFHTFHGYRTPPNRNLDIVVELLRIVKNKENK
tara:strand:- start:32 stop:490 length:459 start_codon:yes stop_codon:yes gene_type:complete